MSEELERLLKIAREMEMSPAAQEAQRRSFAYGNTRIENDAITHDTIDKAAGKLIARDKKD